VVWISTLIAGCDCLTCVVLVREGGQTSLLQSWACHRSLLAVSSLVLSLMSVGVALLTVHLVLQDVWPASFTATTAVASSFVWRGTARGRTAPQMGVAAVTGEHPVTCRVRLA
jgi:hypothetical protein